MFNKPISIAAITSLLACVPLYLLSIRDFQISSSNLPMIALSLFITVLIAVVWARVTSGVSSSTSSPRATSRTTTSSSSTTTSDGDREKGNVKWFNANKGFGFITRDSGDDIFVHFRSIRGEGHRVLRDGQRVEYSVSEGDKGLQADDVAGLA